MRQPNAIPDPPPSAWAQALLAASIAFAVLSVVLLASTL